MNVTLALSLLAIPPILTNTYVGVRQVDRDTVDAARGHGHDRAPDRPRVELPLALPLIFGGIRTSAVNVIATATIAPLRASSRSATRSSTVDVYGDAGRSAAAILVALLADHRRGRPRRAVQRAVTPARLKLSSGAAHAPRIRSPKRRITTP